MAKKVVTHKRHVNSLKAPQNNKDNNAVQNSRVLHRGADKVGNNLSVGKRNALSSSPGVVARLMGVDMLPSHTKQVQKHVEKKHEPHVAKNDSIGNLKRNSKSPRQKKSVSFDSIEENVLDQWSYDNFGRHEHPQEKELQKFKKEFETWLRKSEKKCSRTMSENVKVLEPNKRSLESKRITDQKNKNVDIDLAPSKIVILRSGPDNIGLYSPRTSRESISIEDFLEEVKGRLKCQMMDKKTDKKTICNENPSDPKQIAQRIAKHVRESVTRDLGMNLFRSESTRSYRSDLHINETDASKFISKDSRRFLVDRLKNVLKEESHQHEPILHESTQSSIRKPKDVSESKDKLNKQNRRFIREDEIQVESSSSSSSSTRNLIRSLSAPVSGTSFGKLLLEDRHLHTGAHIRRKHESTEKATTTCNLNQKKKDKFNLKDKVTTLFGKKSQSSDEEHGNGNEITEVISNTSSITDFYDQSEDCAEVPPSPASTSSFISKSISDAASSDANSKAYMEISSNLKELRSQLNELDTDVSEDAMIDELPVDDLRVIEDQDESYIRDLLLVSGLYDGSIHQNLSIWEPISIQVFEEVEESLKHKTNNDQCEKLKLNHKILFDLLNQTLPNVLEPPTSPITRVPVHGKKLLDQVWKIIRVYVDHEREVGQLSVDSMLAKDIKCSLWYTLMDDDVNVIGKDIECQIMRELIDEMVKGMMFRRRRTRRKC